MRRISIWWNLITAGPFCTYLTVQDTTAYCNMLIVNTNTLYLSLKR